MKSVYFFIRSDINTVMGSSHKKGEIPFSITSNRIAIGLCQIFYTVNEMFFDMKLKLALFDAFLQPIMNLEQQSIITDIFKNQ